MNFQPRSHHWICPFSQSSITAPMSATSSVRRQAYSPSTRMTPVADSGPPTTPVSVRCIDVFLPHGRLGA